MSNKVVFKPSKTGHWKELFDSKNQLLGSHNLNVGEKLVAEITGVEVHEIVNQNGQKEKVPVCLFKGNVPPMVLNITNCRTIESLYGPYREDWKGKRIVIFATKVKAFGEETMALRIEQIDPDNVITSQQVDTIRAIISGMDGVEKSMCEWANIPKLEALPSFMFETARGAAQAKAQQAKSS